MSLDVQKFLEKVSAEDKDSIYDNLQHQLKGFNEKDLLSVLTQFKQVLEDQEKTATITYNRYLMEKKQLDSTRLCINEMHKLVSSQFAKKKAPLPDSNKSDGDMNNHPESVESDTEYSRLSDWYHNSEEYGAELSDLVLKHINDTSPSSTLNITSPFLRESLLKPQPPEPPPPITRSNEMDSPFIPVSTASKQSPVEPLKAGMRPKNAASRQSYKHRSHTFDAVASTAKENGSGGLSSDQISLPNTEQMPRRDRPSLRGTPTGPARKSIPAESDEGVVYESRKKDYYQSLKTMFAFLEDGDGDGDSGDDGDVQRYTHVCNTLDMIWKHHLRYLYIVRYVLQGVRACDHNKRLPPALHESLKALSVGDIFQSHEDYDAHLKFLTTSWSPKSDPTTAFDHLLAALPYYKSYITNVGMVRQQIETLIQSKEKTLVDFFEQLRFPTTVPAEEDRFQRAQPHPGGKQTQTFLQILNILPSQPMKIKNDIRSIIDIYPPDNEVSIALEEKLRRFEEELLGVSPLQRAHQEPQRGDPYRASMTSLPGVQNNPATSPRVTNGRRCLRKAEAVIEFTGNKRQPRHLLLFDDVLVCARQRKSQKRRTQTQYSEVGEMQAVWWCALAGLRYSEQPIAPDDFSTVAHFRPAREEAELQESLTKMRDIRKEITTLMTEKYGPNAEWTNEALMAIPAVDKLLKKLTPLEPFVFKWLPMYPIPFDIRNNDNHEQMAHASSRGSLPSVILFESEFDRSDWLAELGKCMAKNPLNPGLSKRHVEELLESYCEQASRSRSTTVAATQLRSVRSFVGGQLNLTLHRMSCVNPDKTGSQNMSAFCCVEVDSYGQFTERCTTPTSKITKGVVLWEEVYAIDLFGSKRLRVMIFMPMPSPGSGQPTSPTDSEANQPSLSSRGRAVLMGTVEMELSAEWLRQEFIERQVAVKSAIPSLPQWALTVSIEYDITSYQPAMIKTIKGHPYFGVPVETLCAHERSEVPGLVQHCIARVEASSESLREEGLYRISPPLAQLKQLQNLWDRSPSKAVTSVKNELDVHRITGLLKTFFRMLPEPLFTNTSEWLSAFETSSAKNYTEIVVNCLNNMPLPNRMTTLAMLKHLRRVSEDVSHNKMGVKNLAMVFGPTLMRPSGRGDAREQTQTEQCCQCVQFLLDNIKNFKVIPDNQGGSLVASKTRLSTGVAVLPPLPGSTSITPEFGGNSIAL